MGSNFSPPPYPPPLPEDIPRSIDQKRGGSLEGETSVHAVSGAGRSGKIFAEVSATLARRGSRARVRGAEGNR